eukprot:5908608-Karenia_brevis.AAC.1
MQTQQSNGTRKKHVIKYNEGRSKVSSLKSKKRQNKANLARLRKCRSKSSLLKSKHQQSHEQR